MKLEWLKLHRVRERRRRGESILLLETKISSFPITNVTAAGGDILGYRHHRISRIFPPRGVREIIINFAEI